MNLGILLVLISACGFGTLAIFGKLAYAEGFSVFCTLAWRFGVAALLLWSWLLLKGGWRLPWRQACFALLLGAVGYAVQATLFFGALSRISAGLTGLLLYLYPSFVILLAWLIEKDRPKAGRLAALALSFLGCFLTSNFQGGLLDLRGLLMGITAAVWYAVYLTFGARLVKEIPPLTTTAYVALGAAISFTVGTFLLGDQKLPQTGSAWGTVAGLAIAATVIPIITLFAGIRRLGTPLAAIISTLEPVVTLILGFALLGESLTAIQGVGALCILGSVFIVQQT